MQSINLTEMNQTLDRMEEKALKKALDKSALEEIVADNETGKTVIKKAIKNDVKDITARKSISRPPESMSGYNSQKNTVQSSYNILQNTEPQDSDEEERRKSLESIPVFRDELDRKFGKKKSFVQETVPKPLFPYKTWTEEKTETVITDDITEPEPYVKPEIPDNIDEIINDHNMHLENTIKEDIIEKDTREQIVEEVIAEEVIEESSTDQTGEAEDEITEDGTIDDAVTNTVEEPEKAMEDIVTEPVQ